MSTALIEDLKKQARAVQRETGCKHCHALEQLAKNNGYNTWAALLHCETKKAKEATDGGV